jgi:hypothetical protein
MSLYYSKMIPPPTEVDSEVALITLVKDCPINMLLFHNIVLLLQHVCL